MGSPAVSIGCAYGRHPEAETVGETLIPSGTGTVALIFEGAMSRKHRLCMLVIIVLFAFVGTAVGQPPTLKFNAPLSGGEIVPPVDTMGRGHAVLQLSRNGTERRFRLIVTNIEDVVTAHIHKGPEGVNGPIAVVLLDVIPRGATIKGIIAEGTLTDAGVIDDVIDEITAGNAYVDVHTRNFPAGEIRGQIYVGDPSLADQAKECLDKLHACFAGYPFFLKQLRMLEENPPINFDQCAQVCDEITTHAICSFVQCFSRCEVAFLSVAPPCQ